MSTYAVRRANIRRGLFEEAKVEVQRVLALEPTFTIKGFLKVIAFEPAVVSVFSSAWQTAGLPVE